VHNTKSRGGGNLRTFLVLNFHSSISIQYMVYATTQLQDHLVDKTVFVNTEFKEK